ncbi:formyl-coenzyme A transferase [Mycolicibacterium canariasense]|uniref:Formyl-coenzyme A transferase n=1 Tax=Mycolicibacterium canariasense TaxID=228230 RepID=A0A100WKV7_MYCCR|nr:CoA transferase [Mycolicibacterium canariasense]MCV7207588.1 CoA transferase [Mycolicibacterium canariasense]ORV08816.1 acyl-CoA transferase [Mycolicibacterium canariasense]GAS99698.1 formyl-coenzyme A transferase [Mycolicibacterium canariasense]
MVPVGAPQQVCAHAQEQADRFAARTGVAVDATALITGRAAQFGWGSRGRISAGGATRLLGGAGGWCAVTLARADDNDAVPALVGADHVGDPWVALGTWVQRHGADATVERARLLGLPAGLLGETAAAAPRIRVTGAASARPLADLLVADLSSMWAGPLCGQLLACAGATVVKVESLARPDGTRAGRQAFCDWMNGGKLSYAVDFDDVRALHRLLSVADVVIEASRPVALRRRGLGPGTVAPRAGRVWLHITGYGTDAPGADWVAFGDDAAVSGGLVEYDSTGPVFVGDAIADPLTGLCAADAVTESLGRGGGELIEVSMAATAARYTGLTGEPCRAPAPRPAARAPALGADNARVQAMIEERWSVSC